MENDDVAPSDMAVARPDGDTISGKEVWLIGGACDDVTMRVWAGDNHDRHYECYDDADGNEDK